jgi:hypothetical protein
MAEAPASMMVWALISGANVAMAALRLLAKVVSARVRKSALLNVWEKMTRDVPMSG